VRPPTTHLPRIACDNEPVARHVERIEIGLESFGLRSIELSVDQDPSRLGGIPVFAHPVILEFARGEISSESTSRPRRNLLLAKDSAQHCAEMTAHAWHSMVRLACGRQRTRVELAHLREHIGERADMSRVCLLRRQLEIMQPRCQVAMYQVTLNDSAQVRDTFGNTCSSEWKGPAVVIGPCLL
jgi:hypothetical protein